MAYEYDFYICALAKELVEYAQLKCKEGWHLNSVCNCVNGFVAFFEREIPEPPKSKWDPNGCETGV